MIASSSKRLPSSTGATYYPALARANDFKNNCPHFLLAAASLVFTR